MAFTHKVHVAKGIECVGCHQGVEQGPDAGLPSVKLCMTCHLAIATDRPEIKKVAAYLQRGEEIPWWRVYGFYPSAHVRFNHAPHIRAGVQCAACHGDMAQQTVAIRAVDLDMGYCLNCHRQKKASVDCITCHLLISDLESTDYADDTDFMGAGTRELSTTTMEVFQLLRD